MKPAVTLPNMTRIVNKESGAPTDPSPCGAGFFHRWRCARRISELERLINTSRMTYVGWGQEIAYIRRTGRLDWVDPNVPAVRPAGERLLPPPPQPR